MSNCLTLTTRKGRSIRRSARWSLFLAAALCLPAGLAWAQTDNGKGNGGVPGNGGVNNPNRSSDSIGAPEIDPSVAASAITILAGGILLVGDRVRRIRRSREG